MTDEELEQYYANLLIMQYASKPKAYATIIATAALFIMNQLPVAVQDAFSIDTAIGVQLDVLGKYVGISRNGYTFSGPITLDDDDYRQVIKMKIVQNNNGSSLYDIENVLNIFFDGAFALFDYGIMRLSYFFTTEIGSNDLAEFLVKQDLLPKPMGVQLSCVIYVPDFTKFFGFRTYENQAFKSTTFNTYSNYDEDTEFLNYGDIING